ncbi:MAG: HD domain-containing protein [Pyrinomonadaceae bacterium]|nr:HD domain-containing protein [Pyrinomonadaceae bacterium]
MNNYSDPALDLMTEALLVALSAASRETGAHSHRTAEIADTLASRLSFTPDERASLRYASLLHDIGKLTSDPAILHKCAALTAEETAHLREHVAASVEMLDRLGFPAAVVRIVAEHHEQFDGTGYPARSSGDSISRGARVFALADALDAILSDRCYRKARTYTEARAEILRCSGTQFDPLVVAAFISIPAERFQ